MSSSNRPSTGSRGSPSTGAGFTDRLHLNGVVLPSGERSDLWIVDGRIRTEPVQNAETLATNVWLMPGLVDAHCHVGLERGGAVPDEVA